MTADQIIATLGLQPHPEGGWFVQTFEDAPGVDGRPASTAIYFLLKAGEVSHWHRVDAAEAWHWYAGDPLELVLARGDSVNRYILGPGVFEGQRPQMVVPAWAWQSARSQGDWSLVGCTVAPGFRFEGFELAPPGWSPNR